MKNPEHNILFQSPYKKNPATQKEFVRNYLLSGLSITPMKALAEARIFRLAAVIHVLRQEGMKITSVRKTTFGGRPYSEYKLASA